MTANDPKRTSPYMFRLLVTLVAMCTGCAELQSAHESQEFGKALRAAAAADAPHCSLASPPGDAGEDNPQGGFMKFYPRAKDLPRSYTGCQIGWLMRDGEWVVFSKRYYSQGTLRVFYGPVINGEPTSICPFANGRLTPESKGACPSFTEASKPAPSLPPGCVGKAASAECSKYE